MILDTFALSTNPLPTLLLFNHVSLAKPIVLLPMFFLPSLVPIPDCFLTPGFFCLNPNCTSVVPNTACLFMDPF